jgi:hypothetical protein
VIAAVRACGQQRCVTTHHRSNTKRHVVGFHVACVVMLTTHAPLYAELHMQLGCWYAHYEDGKVCVRLPSFLESAVLETGGRFSTSENAALAIMYGHWPSYVARQALLPLAVSLLYGCHQQRWWCFVTIRRSC